MVNTSIILKSDMCSKHHNMQFYRQTLGNIKIRNKYGGFVTVIMSLQFLAWVTLIALCKNVFCIICIHKRKS